MFNPSTAAGYGHDDALRRAIPTLTGAVLVVNAAGTSSSALQAEFGSPHETWLEPT